MNKSEFAEILTSLFNGNSGEARQTAENITYNDSFDIKEEWERKQQDRINYQLAKRYRVCYND